MNTSPDDDPYFRGGGRLFVATSPYDTKYISAYVMVWAIMVPGWAATTDPVTWNMAAIMYAYHTTICLTGMLIEKRIAKRGRGVDKGTSKVENLV